MIGGVLTQYFGWHEYFIFLFVFIVLTLVLCCFSLKEILPKKIKIGIEFLHVHESTYNVLLKNFLYYAAVPYFAYASYLAYIVE